METHDSKPSTAPPQPVSEGHVDIAGLDKATVLKALHDGATPMGLGHLQALRGDMPLELAQKLIAASGARLRFDYVLGRPLKVDITNDSFCPFTYDRDAGEGAADRVIATLRRGG